MKKTTFLIVGKHAVLEALKNPSRKIERVFLTEESKKNIIEKVGGYDEKFIYSQDYKLAFDLINLGFKLRIMKNVLYKSNFINNISTTKKKEQEYYANCVRRGIIPKPIV